MIITRTPFRVTLGGGGTDLPSYYREYGGMVLTAAINKYMFINLNRPVVDDLVRVKYSTSEIVEHRDLVKHDLAREALKMMGIEKAIEIISQADVPAGTGLGSSSCYAVGLLNALHTYKREYIGLQELAEEACELEINRLKKPIGKQDQYIAAFGGITLLEIERTGKVNVRPARIEESFRDDLERNLLVFFTGISRDADTILREQGEKTSNKDESVLPQMHRIKELGYQILEALESGNITDFGLLMHKHWECKKQLSGKVSNSHLDEIYERARGLGVLGGKVTGAGGGGFFVFYTETNHNLIRRELAKVGLREMRFRFDLEGTKTLVNLMDSR